MDTDPIETKPGKTGPGRTGPGQTGLGKDSATLDRVKAILLRPRDEWPVIDREATPSGEIFTRYVMPLAAIGPLATFLGGQLFGYGGFWFHYRPSLMGGLSTGIGSYVATLVGLLLVTFILDKLAPRFGGESSQRSAFKLLAYSSTAGFLAGAFQFVPSLGFLGLLGFYSFYLFYTGAGPLMKIPPNRVLGFTVAAVASAFVLGAVLVSLLSAFAGTFRGPAELFDRSTPADGAVEFKVPGAEVTVDTRKLEQAAKDIELAAKTRAVAPAALQALLPETIGAYKRTGVESMKAGPVGSRAEGTYESGDKRFKLSVADMSGIGAIAGIGAAMGVEANKEDADGYEHTTTRDGVLVTEKWRKSGRGEYGTMIGKRFFVQADGEAESIDQLKSAVASVDAGKLAALGN